MSCISRPCQRARASDRDMTSDDDDSCVIGIYIRLKKRPPPSRFWPCSIGRNIKTLLERTDEPHVFRLHNARVFYFRLASASFLEASARGNARCSLRTLLLCAHPPRRGRRVEMLAVLLLGRRALAPRSRAKANSSRRRSLVPASIFRAVALLRVSPRRASLRCPRSPRLLFLVCAPRQAARALHLRRTRSPLCAGCVQ